MSWFAKVKAGLSKTASTISSGIASVVSSKKIDTATIEELEEALITADLGLEATNHVIEIVRKLKVDKASSEHDISTVISDAIAKELEGASKTLSVSHKPHVVLMCGVNGNGKTTTIGKMASKLASEGKSVMVAACDTFRAAAVGQLQVWAERSSADFISGEENADPASVAYKALESAINKGVDVLFIDTAGRLHNKQNLMDELGKIVRVMQKLDESAPHDAILVIDATTGQNAISQVDTFSKTVKLDGLIITKLDGTAKGGIVVNITQKFKLPIYAIGVGEGIEDLDQFVPSEFARAIVGG